MASAKSLSYLLHLNLEIEIKDIVNMCAGILGV